MQSPVDVVDEQDTLTGQVVSMEEAHEKSLPHRVIAVYVFDKNGKLFVQVRKDNGKLDHTVGGHVDAGETYDEAAYRETEEEVGIAGHHLEKLYEGLFSNEGRIHIFAIYECIAPETWSFVPNDEVDKLVSMELSEVVELMNTEGKQKFTWGFIATMRKYLELKESELKVTL